MRRFLKILKWFFLVLAALLVIAVATAILTAKQIEGKIKELFVAEINKRLNTEVNVQTIEFTFLENFPYSTLKFEGVSAKDALGKAEMKRDTLLKAGNIMLRDRAAPRRISDNAKAHPVRHSTSNTLTNQLRKRSTSFCGSTIVADTI